MSFPSGCFFGSSYVFLFLSEEQRASPARYHGLRSERTPLWHAGEVQPRPFSVCPVPGRARIHSQQQTVGKQGLQGRSRRVLLCALAINTESPEGLPPSLVTRVVFLFDFLSRSRWMGFGEILQSEINSRTDFPEKIPRYIFMNTIHFSFRRWYLKE